MGVSRCDCWKLPYGVTLAHAQTHWRGTVVAVALRVRRSIFPDLSDRLGSQNHDRERPLITSIAVGSGHETGTDDRQVTGNSCLTSPAAALRHAVYAGNFLTSAGLRSSGFSGCRSPEGTMPKSMNGCRTGLNWTSGQRTVASTRFQPLGASDGCLPSVTAFLGLERKSPVLLLTFPSPGAIMDRPVTRWSTQQSRGVRRRLPADRSPFPGR